MHLFELHVHRVSADHLELSTRFAIKRIKIPPLGDNVEIFPSAQVLQLGNLQQVDARFQDKILQFVGQDVSLEFDQDAVVNHGVSVSNYGNLVHRSTVRTQRQKIP